MIEVAIVGAGRIRTEQVDGFWLDRGFQFLLTAYPELAHHIDLKALQLRHFAKGAGAARWALSSLR
jgi:hypothetical protein